MNKEKYKNHGASPCPRCGFFSCAILSREHPKDSDRMAEIKALCDRRTTRLIKNLLVYGYELQ